MVIATILMTDIDTTVNNIRTEQANVIIVRYDAASCFMLRPSLCPTASLFMSGGPTDQYLGLLGYNQLWLT